MMRRLISTGLRFRVLMAVGALAVMVAGVSRLDDASVDVYPEFEAPYVEVQTEALGLSAAEVEQLITVPLEADLLNGVAWLEDIRSESVQGLSSITLVFESGTSLFKARQMVQERLAQAHALPNVSKPPQMLQPVSSTSRTVMIGLTSKDLSLIEISQLARWTIKPRLMGLEGVANVATFGQRERQLQVLVDPKRLGEMGVTLLQVIQTAGNSVWVSPLTFLEASTPGTGGFIETPNQRLGVRHVSPIESPEDLAKVAIQDRSALRLGDVAEVVEDHQPLIGDARVGQHPGIVMVVEKLPDANTTDVTERVESALANLRPALKGLDVDTSLFRPADFIRASSDNLSTAMLAGLAMLMLLLALAFYHWRAALVTVVAILVSLTTAALVLELRGATFNLMVLAGLAVALGAVIDDAITGTERAARRLREADGSAQPLGSVILDATLEVRSAMVYATLFAVLPLVPVFFMDDLFGFFGRPLAVAYAVALGASMVVAMLVTPALTLLLASKAPLTSGESPFMAGVGRRYEGLLARVLGEPRRALALVAVLVIAGLVALPQLRESQLPALVERDFLIEMETASGTSLTEMNRLAAKASNELRGIPGVRQVTTQTGRAVTGDKVVGVNNSDLWVTLDQDADYSDTVTAVREAMEGYPGVDIDVLTYQQERIKESQEGADDPVVVRVYGQDLEVLADKADEVRKQLAGIEGIDDLEVELPVSEPSLEVEVDLEKAKGHGVRPGEVRRTAAALLAGVEVGQLFYDQKVFEVVVWGAPQTRQSPGAVRDLLVDTPSRRQVALGDVADVRVIPSPDVIEREGVFRRIDVTASVEGRKVGSVVKDVEQAIGDIDFPLEYRAEVLGEYASKQAAERRLLGLGALAGVCMLLLLQACFGSWRLGVLLFLTLPVALVGGVLAAMADGGTITIGAALGLVAVLSVGARNGTVLIRRYQDMTRRERVAFGPELIINGARERLGPTLMTALATGVVFTPVLVLGQRPGFEILHPMAVVILGGLVTTTLVNLFVIPLLFARFGDVTTEAELDLLRFEAELREGSGPLPPATP